ncbi:MAG: methylhydantoinase [Chloroflexota bacterium]
MYRVGVDIGGTFTDLVLLDDSAGEWQVAKTLTTPAAPEEAVVAGLAELLAASGLRSEQVDRIIHGTTLVTNAIIERKGAPTGLITTEGFRDVLEIGREHRYDMYDIFIELPKPLVPRHLRLGVRERVLADGSVLIPLDEAEVRRAVRQLVAAGVKAVAVCFLHSYANPAHERQAADIIKGEAPQLWVSLSSEVAPEIREYDRFSTTVANVYVRPLVDRYLETLVRRVRGLGLGCEVLIMLSGGGVATVETARQFPIRLVESGPAAGALAAAFLAGEAGFPDVLAFDMGGTTAKACLIENGQPLTSPEFEVARTYRFKKGSGLPVKVNVIELIEIGAGGGSIARVDSLGLLKVGPESAGAEPGPACYGRGGTEPTVTDADLVLGYLDPNYFLGGRMRLDRAAAEAAVGRLAERLGLSLVEAAWGIHEVVTENMAAAARVHAIERGKDIRKFPLFAFGGAGPVHVYRLAQKLGLKRFVCPPGAGATSALGLLVAPLAFDFVRSYYGRLDAIDWEVVNRLLAEMEAEGRALLGRAGLSPEEVTVVRTADFRYAGQGHEVNVVLPEGELGEGFVGEILRRFVAEYRRLYHRAGPEVPVEAVTWRVKVSGPKPAIAPRRAGQRPGRPEDALKGYRPAYFAEYGDFRPTPVYDRYALGPGTVLEGPAIIEERESTVVLGPRAVARVDDRLNLVGELV